MGTSACSALSDDAGTGPSATLPDVEGQWSGAFRTPSCTVSAAALDGYCDQVTAADAVPFVLTLAQFEGELVGSLQVVDAIIPLSGTVDAGGRIRLSGSAAAPVDGAGTVTIRIEDWDTTADGDRLTGGWRSEAQASGTGDTARGTHVIVDAAKTR